MDLLLLRVVAQYSQWDGYPTGQGVKLFDFLHVEGNIARLRAGLAYIYEPTKEELKKIPEAVEAEVARVKALDHKDLCSYLASHMPEYLRKEKPEELDEQQSGLLLDLTLTTLDQYEVLFPSLSRSTGGKILELIANATADHKLPIQSQLEFAAGTLHETLSDTVTA